MVVVTAGWREIRKAAKRVVHWVVVRVLTKAGWRDYCSVEQRAWLWVAVMAVDLVEAMVGQMAKSMVVKKVGLLAVSKGSPMVGQTGGY